MTGGAFFVTMALHPMSHRFLLVATIASALVACSSSSSPDDTTDPAEADGGPSSDGGASSGDGGGDGSADDVFGGVPVGGDELGAFLRAKKYASWTSEPAVHDSAMGPHGRIRTYFNASLEASLKAGGKKHDKGAIAVKETYDLSDVHQGWLVAIKIADESASGAGWHWYELTSKEPSATPKADGKNLSACAPCHSGSSTDFIFSKL